MAQILQDFATEYMRKIESDLQSKNSSFPLFWLQAVLTRKTWHTFFYNFAQISHKTKGISTQFVRPTFFFWTSVQEVQPRNLTEIKRTLYTQF